MMSRTKKLRGCGVISYLLTASTGRHWFLENELLVQHLPHSPILAKGVQQGELAYSRSRVMGDKKNNTKKISEI